MASASGSVGVNEAAAQPSWPPLWLTALAGVLCMKMLWPFHTHDMDTYLVPWLEHIVAKGPIGVFAEPFSNYTPPYLYLLAAVSPLAAMMSKVTLIKLLSVAGNVWLAFAVHRLVAASGARPDLRLAALLLVLPSMMINAAMFGQCDALWAAACVAALTAAVRRRHAAMLVWCGIAVAIKLQAVFAAPFFIALLIAERAPLRLWLVAPAVFVAAMLPAWIAGWPAADLATIYLRQSAWFEELSLNAPNIWMWVQHLPATAALPMVAIAYGAAGLATSLYLWWLGGRRLDPADMIAAALLASLMLPGLLPKMHERYFFLADILAFALAAVARDRSSFLVCVIVQAGSCLALWAYLTDSPNAAVAGAVGMIAATATVAARLAPARPGSAVIGAAA
jgi:Gpi18-like mannosyltransferase